MSAAPILVTGAAGFVGFHVAQRLLAQGARVTGLDVMSDYYDVSLKQARLAQLTPHANFDFVRSDVADAPALRALCVERRYAAIVHLAAQAGVRHSLTHPFEYAHANLTGFLSVLEAARAAPPAHLVYASSSSVYGLNSKMPFAVANPADHPVSLYGATKRANELMAHSYAHLYGLPLTGLRFFTVYGPWGRPDMAYYSFARAMLRGETIPVFNQGQLKRDFTYIDDIVTALLRVVDAPPRAGDAAPDQPGRSSAPHRVYNIGNREPVELMRFIRALEAALGVSAKIELLPMQPGDVLATEADVSDLEALIGSVPRTSIEDGLARFAAWFRAYHASV
jgi:UDP-glucuronate 4-epimerase